MRSLCSILNTYRVIAITVLFIVLLCHSPAWSGTKKIVAEGVYNMGDGETPLVAEKRALLQAKRVALEEAGIYITSYTTLKNSKLTEDEVQVIASGIMEVDVLGRKRTIVGGGIRFWVKIKAKVTTDKLEEMVRKLKDRSLVEDYKKIKDEYIKLDKEMEQIKKQLAMANDEKEKEQLKSKILNEERLFEANTWIEKGKIYYEKSEYDAALASFTSAIALNPNSTLAYLKRGSTYYGQKLYDEAIKDFSMALRIDPNDYFAYSFRGDAYADKKRYGIALKDYNTAISIAPNKIYAYDARGGVYASQKKYERAIKDYNKAISIEPNDFSPLVGRGMAYAEMGLYDKAIEDYNKAFTLYPDFFLIYELRADAYSASKEYDKAIEDYNRMLQRVPGNFYAYNSRAVTYFAKEEYGKAIKDYKLAIRLNFNYAIAHYNLGKAYLKIGETATVMDEYKILKSIDEDIAGKLLEEAIVGLWRSSNGSLVRLEADGKTIITYMVSPSPIAVELGYKVGDTLFFGKIKNLTAQGTYNVKYGADFENCYPEGRTLSAIGIVDSDMKHLSVEFQNRLIDKNCYEKGKLKVVLTLSRELNAGRYYNKDKGFSIAIPSEWEKKDNYMGMTTVALSPRESLKDQFRENVVVIVEELPDTMSLSVYYKTIIANMRKQSPDLKIYKQKEVLINRRKAIWVTYSYLSGQRMLKGILFVIRKDERGYQLTFTAERSKFLMYENEFRRIAGSFR